MTELPKLKKGDQVYVERIGRYGYAPSGTYTVAGAGSKFFTLENLANTKFAQKDRIEESKYSRNYRIWLNEQQYKDHQETAVLYQSIGRHFSTFSDKPRLSLETLRAIKQVIDNQK